MVDQIVYRLICRALAALALAVRVLRAFRLGLCGLRGAVLPQLDLDYVQSGITYLRWADDVIDNDGMDGGWKMLETRIVLSTPNSAIRASINS